MKKLKEFSNNYPNLIAGIKLVFFLYLFFLSLELMGDSMKLFGKDFDSTKLPSTKPLESISKSALYEGLKKATKNTVKGEYGKGQHSFKILTHINAHKVANHGKHSKEFFEYLRGKLR